MGCSCVSDSQSHKIHRYCFRLEVRWFDIHPNLLALFAPGLCPLSSGSGPRPLTPGSLFLLLGSQFPVSGSCFPVPGSWFMAPDLWLLVSSSQFLTLDSGLLAPDFLAYSTWIAGLVVLCPLTLTRWIVGLLAHRLTGSHFMTPGLKFFVHLPSILPHL